jgi:hypothetical protein
MTIRPRSFFSLASWLVAPFCVLFFGAVTGNTAPPKFDKDKKEAHEGGRGEKRRLWIRSPNKKNKKDRPHFGREPVFLIIERFDGQIGQRRTNKRTDTQGEIHKGIPKGAALYFSERRE